MLDVLAAMTLGAVSYNTGSSNSFLIGRPKQDALIFFWTYGGVMLYQWDAQARTLQMVLNTTTSLSLAYQNNLGSLSVREYDDSPYSSRGVLLALLYA